MHDDESVKNIYITDVETTERWLADAYPRNILKPPTDSGFVPGSDPISILIIFSLLTTQHVV